MINGIIPCAGDAQRFGGINKALLPCDEFDSFLSRTVEQMLDAHCDKVFIICNISNVDEIIRHIERRGFPQVIYKLQVGDNDIWSAIKTVLDICEPTATQYSQYLFAMPDTFMPINTMREVAFQTSVTSFTMGLFDTDKPERFGVVDRLNKTIINKSANIRAENLKAWGALGWRHEVVKFWNDANEFEQIENYTHALNLAYRAFGAGYVDISFYYDMATFEDYKSFLVKGVENE